MASPGGQDDREYRAVPISVLNQSVPCLILPRHPEFFVETTMRLVATWLAILGMIATVLRMVMRGLLDMEHAAFALVLGVILLSAGRKWRTLLLPGVSCALFIRQQTGPDPNAFWQVFSQVLTLSLMLLGIYVMVRGAFGSRHSG